ncbi:MAG TPA: ribonuclease D [Steroidobacteraceae bacterium]|jgi:ribonuclease D|nr:ribonuclease D [Steroidobacteraceae bacterium]
MAIIGDPNTLVQFSHELSQQPAIGLDTEFMRERTYFARLCLLQLSFGARCVCVDTLALPDLASLRATMGDRNIIKVLHAARQDLEVLAPATGQVVGLFDTQVAAALIGLPAQVGYGDLVHQLLGQTLHKAQTRTDWSHRPLTQAQIDYALDDVRHLLPLRERLTQRLRTLGRWAWFEEEMAQLDGAGPFVTDPEEAWHRIKGVGELDAARQTLARALAAWRERRAISADRPRSWILPDQVLRDLVIQAPRTMQQLGRIEELPEGVRTHSGPELLAVIADLQLPAQLPPLPRRTRREPAENDRVRKLAQVTQQAGRELGIAPEILATRRELERLVAGARDGAPMSGWRQAVIGNRLLQAL